MTRFLMSIAASVATLVAAGVTLNVEALMFLAGHNGCC